MSLKEQKGPGIPTFSVSSQALPVSETPGGRGRLGSSLAPAEVTNQELLPVVQTADLLECIDFIFSHAAGLIEMNTNLKSKQ